MTATAQNGARSVRAAEQPMPSHDQAAEEVVLGSMLLSAQAIDEVAAVISPAAHYRPSHQTVHEAILELHRRGEPVDAVTVARELLRRGELVRIGGAPYLHTLIASVPTATNAAYYAEIVADMAARRRMSEAGQRLQQLAEHPTGDVTDLLGRARQTLDEALPATAARPSTWRPVDLTAVLDGTHVPPLPSAGARDDTVGCSIPGASTACPASPRAGRPG